MSAGSGAVWLTLGIALAVMAMPACFWAWGRALQTSLAARVAAAAAEQARARYEEATERLAAGWIPPPYELPRPRPSARRCAACGSAQDPLLPAFAGDGRIAIFYCRDTQECIDRRRSLT